MTDRHRICTDRREHRDLAGMVNTAVFELGMSHRYELTWRWDDRAPLLVVCMLNPSTADERALDPTIKGLQRRAMRNMGAPAGAWRQVAPGGVHVVNCFAYRATDPTRMRIAADPVGEWNDAFIRDAAAIALGQGTPLVCAWGKHAAHLGRDRQVVDLLRSTGVELAAYGLNIDGSPRHPLYIGDHVPPMPWVPE